ncbi:MAG: hypothetical protein LBT14_13560 [Treponema sp.]|jgi:hypothetical protein|nr:hypothetical protein [Treponema sp.]
MKSNKEQLQSRGFVTDDDLLVYNTLNESQLIESKEPQKRTIGIKLLSKYNKEEYIPLFCKLLEKENKLYTKIALCDALIEYKEKSVPFLLPLVGTIGNNQHKKIEIIDLDKKSYPLPRDIIARILIRIGPKVFPEIKEIIKLNKNHNQITELIDVVGHISWNFNDTSLENILIEFYNKNKEHEFMVWKIIRAFQSFNSQKVIDILENTIKTNKNDVIVAEAKRSIKRIKERK